MVVHAGTCLQPPLSLIQRRRYLHRGSNHSKAPCALLGSLFGKQTEALPDQLPEASLEWLHSRGLPPQKLAARDCGLEGRGLVATSRIKPGEPLLRVPRALLLTASDAAAQSQLSAILERGDLPAWSVLAFCLVECRLGQASPWQPYIGMLPEASNGVLEWKESQVDSLLAGSQLLEDARAIRAAADASWEQLQPLLAEPAAHAAFGGRRPGRPDFQWAFSMLLSRLIRLSSLNDMEALVPWADLLNHSPQAATCLDWDAASESVVFRAEAAAAPGEQVYASYGARSSGALLLSYGFMPGGVNPHEAVDLELRLPGGDPLHAEKARTLAACGLGQSQRFPLRLGAFPDGMMQYAAILAAPDADALQNAWTAQRSGEQRLDSSGRLAALALLKNRCAAQLAAMAKHSTPAEAGASPDADAPRVEQLVAEVRTRERRILERAKFLLTRERSQLRS